MGPELASYLFGDFRYPQDRDEWCDFFEHLVRAYDVLHDKPTAVDVVAKDGRSFTQPIVGAAVAKIVTPEIRTFINERIAAGDPSPIIRAEVERIYGVQISSSYMSKLRTRTKGTNL